MDLTKRFSYLKKVLALGKSVALEQSNIDVFFHRFKQDHLSTLIEKVQSQFKVPLFSTASDNNILENIEFDYPIFVPRGMKESSQCILLLHGLNERTWDKYGCWAEELAEKLQRPVLLFPIAFHMSRSPKEWSNPHASMQWVRHRKQNHDAVSNSTYLNIALSKRLTSDPMRFYISGAETVINLLQWMRQIQEGELSFINKNTQIDVFAYSIGGMIAQVLFQSQLSPIINKAKLFLFCSGGVFQKMNGNSRYIMDDITFNALQEFYIHDFSHRHYEGIDPLAYQFQSLVASENHQKERETFYRENQERIKVVSLKKDSVIPTASIQGALGEEISKQLLQEIDFPFEYSHETPFPVGKVDDEILNQAFHQVFDSVIAFFDDKK